MAAVTLRYLSVCSGIEAATVAWHPLGWTPAAFSEIEAFPRAVLHHHYPDVPLHGDFTTIKGDEYGPIDLLVGGTPCQSFSVAGLRGGMADSRGNLALEFLRLLDCTRARWMVWENVPGVLSSSDGRDFGAFLGGLAELGYGFAYRVLDAQHFGVPQRRRRVFVVGHLGDWRRAAAVLFERHSLSGDTPPRREKGEAVAGCLSPGAHPGGFNGQDAYTNQLVADAFTPSGFAGYREGVGTARAEGGDYGGGSETLIAHSLRAEGFDASEDGTGRGTPLVPVAFAHQQGGSVDLHMATDMGLTLQKSQGQAVCFTAKDHGADASDISPTLRSGSHDGSHANGGVMPAVAIPVLDDQGGSVMNVSWDVSPCLRRETHGNIPAIADGGRNGRLDDRSLSRSEDLSAWTVRTLREAASGGSPQERQLAGQSARELDAALSKLSHQGASPEEALHHLRSTSEGARLLQQASAALQTMGRSYAGENQPEHPRSAVRRLTPRECERLQGFPDDYTAVPYRGKPAADGPRYKALGNSMAVPVMRWIGERIQLVEALAVRAQAA